MAAQPGATKLLRLILAALAGLAKIVLRLGVVIGVYALSALGGSVLAALSSSGALGTALLSGLGGVLLLPLALTAGFVAWLMPAAIRIYARGGDPDVDYAVPKRLDACLLVVVTVVLSVAGARWMDVSETGFACLALASTTLIVAAGGAKVAELWGQILMAGLE